MTQQPERPGAEAWVPDDPTLPALAAAVQGCRGCELYRDATQAVMGEGPGHAKVVLLGEQPGEREDVEGKPFVGPAGKLLVEALGDAGIDPRGLPHQCRQALPLVGHTRQATHPQEPRQVHIAACGPWMVAELDLVRPAGLVLLGATAGKAVYGASFGSARRAAAWPTSRRAARAPAADHAPSWVLATTHPAAVLRSRERDADYELLRRRPARRGEVDGAR